MGHVRGLCQNTLIEYAMGYSVAPKNLKKKGWNESLGTMCRGVCKWPISNLITGVGQKCRHLRGQNGLQGEATEQAPLHDPQSPEGHPNSQGNAKTRATAESLRRHTTSCPPTSSASLPSAYGRTGLTFSPPSTKRGTEPTRTTGTKQCVHSGRSTWSGQSSCAATAPTWTPTYPPASGGLSQAYQPMPTPAHLPPGHCRRHAPGRPHHCRPQRQESPLIPLGSGLETPRPPLLQLHLQIHPHPKLHSPHRGRPHPLPGAGRGVP